MIERAALLSLATVGLLLVVLAVRWWARRTAVRVTRGPVAPLWEALGTAPDGRPTVVAFSTPSCAACHAAQRPALQQLQHSLGEPAVRVLHVDAASQPHVAKRFGVLTVPSTVVLGPSGRVLAVNHGFAPATRLAAQAQLTAA